MRLSNWWKAWFLVGSLASLATTGCQQETAAESKPQEARAKLDPEKEKIMDEQLKNWDPSKDK